VNLRNEKASTKKKKVPISGCRGVLLLGCQACRDKRSMGVTLLFITGLIKRERNHRLRSLFHELVVPQFMV
jgi:hypothetical protein